MIIERLKDYIKTCPYLGAGSPLYVNNLIPDPTGYSINPVQGTKVLKRYMSGVTINEYPFTLTYNDFTDTDIQRLESSGFVEQFSAWLDKQTRSRTLPALDQGQTPRKIYCDSWGGLFETDAGGKNGIYQIVCKLEYQQDT